jgi:hypothetical protein
VVSGAGRAVPLHHCFHCVRSKRNNITPATTIAIPAMTQSPSDIYYTCLPSDSTVGGGVTQSIFGRGYIATPLQ